MRLRQWQEEYSVGVKELDDQHRTLLNIINTLVEKQSDFENQKYFTTNLPSLIHYAYTHFATEEGYLHKANFPDLQQHILEHVDFIMQTLSLSEKSKTHDMTSRKELLDFLEKWYALHVLGSDRHYISALTKAGFK